MDVSVFIAKRLGMKGKMATVCIAVSFLVMIIAVAVSSGFRHAIRDGLSDISGDIQITSVNMNYLGDSSPIDRDPAYLEILEGMEGVESVSPVIYRAGIVKNGDDIHGVVFKGVEEAPGASLEVSIPRRLSEILELDAGDDMLVYFVGEKVRFRKFKVASIYESMLDADDKLIVYAGIGDMQRLNGWNPEQISAFEVNLDRKHRGVEDMNAIAAEVGFSIYSETAEDGSRVFADSSVSRYRQIFDWLDLIDFNVLFILVLMTIVAGFNMISGLLIMLFENISTIGLLKALGMTDRAISRTFLTVASANVLKGMGIGNLLALAFCLVQGSTHFIKLDPGNYFIGFVPVHLDLWMILLADLAVYVVIMLLLLIPSLFISKVDPSETVTMK